MKGFNKIITALILFCFAVNSTCFGFEYNSFKLSPPSNFSRMKGPEFKDAAQITIGLRKALGGLQTFNLETLRGLKAVDFEEKSVFSSRITGSIYFDTAQEVLDVDGMQVEASGGAYVVKAKAGGREYYCLVSKKTHGYLYDISVISARALKDKVREGNVRFAHASINPKDRDILDLYLDHEISTANNKVIDPFIEKKMLAGYYAVDEETARDNPLYRHPKRQTYSRSRYEAMVADMMTRLKLVGVRDENITKFRKRLLETPLVLIPFRHYDGLPALPTVTIDGKKVDVTAHSSQFATYVFVPQTLYTAMMNGDYDIVLDYIERNLWHELGAIGGLDVKVRPGMTFNIAWNILDQAAADYKEAVKHGRRFTPPAELADLKPVNLLELELRNDYAAGTTAAKNGIFRQVIKAAFVGILAASGYSCATIPSETAPVVESPARPRERADVKDRVADVPSPAAKAIVTHSDLRTVTALLRALTDKDDKVSASAAEALDNIKEPDPRIAAYLIIKAVKDKDPLVRQKAAVLLGKLRDSKETPYLVSGDIPGALKDPRMVPELLRTLGDDDPVVRDSAEEALVNITDPRAVPYLIDALKSADPRICRVAAKSLGAYNDPRAVPPLVEVLKKNYNSIGPEAARALAKIQDPRVLPALIEALGQGYGIQEAAAEAVANLQDERALPALLARLKQTNWSDYQVREGIKLALVKSKDPRAFPTLVEALKDRSIQFSVVEVLGVRGDKAAAKPIASIFDPSVKAPRFCQVVAQAVHKLGDPEASDTLVEKLLKGLNGNDIEIRWTSFVGLKVFADNQKAKPVIEPLLKDPVLSDVCELGASPWGANAEEGNCKWAAQRLGASGDKRAIEPLNEALRYWSGDSTVLDACSKALEKLEKGARPETPRGQPGPVGVEGAVGGALGQAAPLAAAPAENAEQLTKRIAGLIQALGDPKTADEARSALVVIGKPAYPAVLDALNSKDWRTRSEAVIAAYWIGGDGAGRAFAPLLKDDNLVVFANAANALRDMGYPLTQEDLDPLRRFPMSMDDDGMAEEGPAQDEGLVEYSARKAAERLFKQGVAIRSGIKLLKNPDTVQEGVNMLGRFGRRAGLQVAPLLANDDKWVRAGTAEVLGRARYMASEDAIIALLSKDREWTVRASGAKALGFMGTEKAVLALIPALEDTNVSVCDEAAKALGEIGAAAKPALPALQKRLDTMSERDRGNLFDVTVRQAIKKIKEATEQKEPAKGAPGAVGVEGDIGIPAAQIKTGEPSVDGAVDIMLRLGTGEITPEEARLELMMTMPPEIVASGESDRICNELIGIAVPAAASLGLRRSAFAAPGDDEIRTLAARIKSEEIEVFIPASQLPANMSANFRRTLESVFGDRLRIYDRLEDLPGMIKDPRKAVVMTVDLSAEDVGRLDAVATARLAGARFMNFEKMDMEKMGAEEVDNYMAETLSALLVARTITQDEAGDKGSFAYRMLAHLLEDRMPDLGETDNYIRTLADNSMNPIEKLRYLLRAILKKVPVEKYSILRHAVEVLWSA